MVPVNLRDCFAITDYRTQTHKSISNKQYAEASKALKKTIGNEAAVDLIDGKCKILTVIESTGGHEGMAKRLTTFLDYIKAQGSSLKAYIYTTAYEAAFTVAASFDEKYCLPDTEFLMHKGNIPAQADTENEQEEDEHEETAQPQDMSAYTMYLDLFFKKMEPQYQSAYQKIKELAIKHIKADIYFSGKHLATWGLAKTFPNADELTKAFTGDFGLELSPTGFVMNTLNQLITKSNAHQQKGMFSVIEGQPTNSSPQMIMHAV